MRKTIFRTFIAAALMSFCFSVPAFAENAVVTGTEVNLRSGPGTNYKIINCLAGGSSVQVTDCSNGSWYAVNYGSQSGYMAAAYISLSSDPFAGDLGSGTVITGGQSGQISGGLDLGGQGSGGQNGSSQSSQSNGYINAMYVRFRSGPSNSAAILAEYNLGKALTITGVSGDWTACTIDGQSGYVFSQYVSSGSYSGSGSTIVSGDNDIFLDYPDGNSSLTPPSSTPIYPGSGDSQTSDPGFELGTSTPVPSSTPAPCPSVVPSQEQTGYINGDTVRFRTGPSTSYSIIDSYDKGTAVTVIGTSGDWYLCTINGVSGYVYSQYVTLSSSAGTELPGLEVPDSSVDVPQDTTPPLDSSTQTQGYISGNNVRMRAGASMNSQILCELFYGNTVTITGTTGEWTAVIYNGQAGYVYSQYVKEGSYSNTVSPDAGGTAAGRQVADFALQFVGYNYSWGGASPETGFDCSGLVYYTYKNFGYTLNRVACDQAQNGVHVEPSDLQPGDILCFYSGGSYIGHVGIYIGDGKFVHAANSSTGVIISELSGYYADRGYEARRIIT